MSGFVDIGALPAQVAWRGACVLARDGAGRVLMQLRDDRPDIAAPAQWSLFGGGVEPGESLEDAARREFHEETGIDIAQDRLDPVARFASCAVEDGIVHVFALHRALAPADVTVFEGAGFAFLTDAQIARFDVIDGFRKVLAGPGGR